MMNIFAPGRYPLSTEYINFGILDRWSWQFSIAVVVYCKNVLIMKCKICATSKKRVLKSWKVCLTRIFPQEQYVRNYKNKYWLIKWKLNYLCSALQATFSNLYARHYPFFLIPSFFPKAGRDLEIVRLESVHRGQLPSCACVCLCMRCPSPRYWLIFNFGICIFQICHFRSKSWSDPRLLRKLSGSKKPVLLNIHSYKLH